MYNDLRVIGWNGYWIDVVLVFCMKDDVVIILDLVNCKEIDSGIEKGICIYVGGNCMVFFMFLVFGGLFEKDLVEWVLLMIY